MNALKDKDVNEEELRIGLAHFILEQEKITGCNTINNDLARIVTGYKEVTNPQNGQRLIVPVIKIK